MKQEFPLCDACRLPMKVGQVGRHYVCTPGHPAHAVWQARKQAENAGPMKDPFEIGMERSQEAADAGWTPIEIIQVDRTICAIADRMDNFTADDVWEALGPDFPVTKGLAARLVSAQRRGLIASTDRTRKSTRGGAHDHGQRLTVWTSLTKKGLFS